MQQFNLIDPRLLPPPLILSGVRLAAVALLVVVALAVHTGQERQRLSRTLAQASAPAAGAGDAPAEGGEGAAPEAGEAALQATIRQRRALRDLIAKADDRPADGASMMRSVIAALPPTVWLTEIDLRGRQGLRIAGGTLDPVSLRSLAERLSQIDALRGVAVETLRIEPSEEEAAGDSGLPPTHSFVLASAAYLAAGTGP